MVVGTNQPQLIDRNSTMSASASADDDGCSHRCGSNGKCACSGAATIETLRAVFGSVIPDAVAWEVDYTDDCTKKMVRLVAFVRQLQESIPPYLRTREDLAEDFNTGHRHVRLYITDDAMMKKYKVHVIWRRGSFPCEGSGMDMNDAVLKASVPDRDAFLAELKRVESSEASSSSSS